MSELKRNIKEFIIENFLFGNANGLSTTSEWFTQNSVVTSTNEDGDRFGWALAAGNFDNDPVRRGEWIRKKLLAGNVMDVPVDVDAQVPDDETKTLRERFEVVRAEECWRCHIKMNPLGMPFESYNHVGRFRELELGKPVDGRLDHRLQAAGIHPEPVAEQCQGSRASHRLAHVVSCSRASMWPCSRASIVAWS